jgi:hypothetical protein
MPQVASIHGVDIDRVFLVTLVWAYINLLLSLDDSGPGCAAYDAGAA